MMSESFPPARVLRALTSDHHIRFTVLDAGPLWDGVRRGHPHLEAEACGCLVELFSAALLLQARTFFSERLQLMLRGSGRAKALVVDSWPEGDIRGVLDISEENRSGAWVQAPGFLRVMRSNPKGQPYSGTLELIDGSVQAQIEAYLLQSEQVQASATLWCDPGTGGAGALLVEPLPNCPRERLGRLVDAIESLTVVPFWEREPEFLCRWINQGEGAEILSATEVQYRCRCNKGNLVEILRGFDRAKLDELFQDEGPVEVRCDYCGKAYWIQRAEVPGRENERHGES
jgi:molecular chaperone Hsp33